MMTPTEDQIGSYIAASGKAAWEVPGLPADTPALYAESVSTENQRLTRSTVTDLAAALLASDSKLPGLILYGPLADGDV